MIKLKFFLLCFLIGLVCNVSISIPDDEWSDRELQLIYSLSIPVKASEIKNAVHTKDSLAVMLGKLLFFEEDWGVKASISCATCHIPKLGFTDGLKVGIGLDTLNRNTPTILGLAENDWFYWDGRRNSLWSQALTPLEHPNEMNLKRNEIVEYVKNHQTYARLYDKIYGRIQKDKSVDINNFDKKEKQIKRDFINIGKSIEAYIKTLSYTPAKFDRYVEELKTIPSPKVSIFSENEKNGLRLFISDRAQCIRCHNGPNFSNADFHNNGIPNTTVLPDFGRSFGILSFKSSEFKNDEVNQNGSLNEEDSFQQPTSYLGAFKTPSLRNVALTAPYMHNGEFLDLTEVLEHYKNAPVANYGKTELNKLSLKEEEIEDIIEFLYTLNSENLHLKQP